MQWTRDEHAKNEQVERTIEQTAMTITIDPKIEAHFRARADAAGLSIDAYIQRLLDADASAAYELESLALEAFRGTDRSRTGLLGRETPPSGSEPEEGGQALTASGYVLRPAADRDLDAQAIYYADTATSEVGHRFLIEAHSTFSLLATQPEMGWHPRLWCPQLRF